jgi:hypothetical protein
VEEVALVLRNRGWGTGDGLSAEEASASGRTPNLSMERRRRSGSMPNGWGLVEKSLVEKMVGATELLRVNPRALKLRVINGEWYMDLLAER